MISFSVGDRRGSSGPSEKSVPFPQNGQPWKIQCNMIFCKGLWPFYSICGVTVSKNLGEDEWGHSWGLADMWQGACGGGIVTLAPAARMEGWLSQGKGCLLLPPQTWRSVDWRQHCSGDTGRSTNTRLKPKSGQLLYNPNDPMSNVSKSYKNQ